MTALSIRTATSDDLEVLRELFRLSSLSNEGDRANLLSSPEALLWTGEGFAAGRTRVEADGLGRILGFASVVSIEGGQELEDLRAASRALRRASRRIQTGDRPILDPGRGSPHGLNVDIYPGQSPSGLEAKKLAHHVGRPGEHLAIALEDVPHDDLVHVLPVHPAGVLHR